MDEGIPMNKNIKLLYVENDKKDYDLEAVLETMQLHKLVSVTNTKAAIKEFINEYKTQPFNVTLISELSNKEEIELLKALIETDPDQYIILLYQEIDGNKVLNAIKHGASGVLSAPFTADKLRLELEKYSLLREEKRAFNA